MPGRSLLTILSAGFCALVWLCPAAAAAADIGQPAPALVVAQLSGEKFDLAAQHGKVVIVNFWATWCAPCREEMPLLDKFYRQHRNSGIELIGVSTDKSRDRDKVVETMNAFSYPAGLIAESEDNGFGRPTALPVTYVIDKSGIVRAVFTPETSVLTEAWLESKILPLTNQPAQ